MAVLQFLLHSLNEKSCGPCNNNNISTIKSFQMGKPQNIIFAKLSIFFHRRLIFHFSTKNRSPKFPKNAKTYFSPSVFVFQSLLKAFIPQKITFANKKMIYLQKNLISTLRMVSRKKEKQIKNWKDLKYLFYKKDYVYYI